jgi:hypothetical protein
LSYDKTFFVKRTPCTIYQPPSQKISARGRGERRSGTSEPTTSGRAVLEKTRKKRTQSHRDLPNTSKGRYSASFRSAADQNERMTGAGVCV